MIHYNTKNVSFLKVAKILKDKGIKNYAFFLVLYDESLADVDPYDENLTDDQKNRQYPRLQRPKIRSLMFLLSWINYDSDSHSR